MHGEQHNPAGAHPGAPQVHISPHPAEWKPRVPDNKARRCRDQLGLPTDRQIVLSGHQAGFWHPGILAKRLSAQACAAAHQAEPVWLVVDQDDNDPAAIRRPDVGAHDRLVERTVDLDADTHAPGTPTASRPPLAPRNSGDAPIDAPAEAMIRAMDRCSGETSLARQAAGAAELLAAELTQTPPVRLVYCTDLVCTDAFGDLLDHLAAYPRAAVESYNAAAAEVPGAQVRPLTSRPDAGRYELPLWRLRDGEPRVPVYSTSLPRIPRDQLAPRALLMTLLCRRVIADLFIHGTGGGAYDLATERWAREWLGEDLAPMTVATASLTLDLGVEPITEADLAEARWRAHHARHDPRELGDLDAADAKDRLLRRVRTEADPSEPFAEMHELLADYRARHADRLAALDAEAHRLAEGMAQGRLAADRTWPFPLHEPARLRELRGEIDHRFGLDRLSRGTGR